MTKKYIMFKSTLGVCFLVLLFAQIISNVQSSIDDDMITVVSTVDGYVHAIDSRMQKLWSTDTGGSTIKSQNSALNQEAVIPAVDGSLLVHSKEGMLKTSVTARMLTEHTPFISKDGILYHGRKSNRIVGLNAYDGNIIHDSNWESTNSIVRRVESKSPHRKLSPIWIGRMDYAVRATKADNGEEQFNFSYGEIKPLRGNSGVQHASLLEDSDGSIVSVEDFAGQSIISTPSGQVYFSDRAGTSFIDYPIELNSPVQSAFQVKFSNSQISRPNKSKYSIQNVEVYHKRDRHDPAYSDKKELALVPKEEVNLRSEVVLLHYGESLVYGEVDHYDAGDDDLKNVFSSNPFAVSVAPFPSNSGLKVPTVSSNVKGYEFDNFNQENMDSSLLVKENTQTGTLSTIKRFNFRSHPSSLLAKVKGRGIRNVERVGDNGLVLVSADLADASGQHAFCNLLTNSQQTSRINFDLKSVCFFLDQCDIRMKDIFNSICSGSENAIGNEDSRKKTSPKAFRLHHQEYGGGIFDADLSFQAFKNKLSISSHAASVTYNKTKKDYIYLYTIYFVLLMTSLAVTVSVLLLWWLRSSPFSSLLPQGPFVMQWVQSLYYLMNFIKSKEKSVLLSKFMASYDSTFSYDDVVESVNQNLSDDSSKVGALTIEETILGYGSQGTVVFRGSLNGRPVAVKRMLAHFNSSAEREISLLIKSDGHPNVVRYFLRERRSDFVYLALQLCEMSLRDFVVKLKSNSVSLMQNGACNIEITDEVRSSLLQISEGLAHLHAQRIVHRDIKPHNILCALPSENTESHLKLSTICSSDHLGGKEAFTLSMLGKYVLKISDMGLSKQLDHAGQSFSFTSFSVETYGQNQQLKENNQSVDNHMHNNNLVGTIGWQAPELVVQRNCETSQSYTMDGSGDCKTNRGEDRTIESSSIHRKTQNVDIFSLGCVLYYVLTLGEHPFGNWYEREINIVNHRYNLSHLACPDAAALIESMISAEPENRPSAKEVCAHPFFWSSSKRLEFLTELSDRLEQESPNSPMVLSLEANASNIVGVGWDRKLESALLEDMGKYRKYDTNSVRDLLRLIRNKRHHYHELTADIKKVVGNLPNEFLNYFEVRFPKLTLHCHGIHQQFLTSDGKDLFYEENNQKKALNHSKIISDTANLDIESSEGIIPKALDFDTKEKNLEFSDVTIWQNSSLEKSLKCQGWWRVTNSWIESKSTKKMRPSHLAKSAVDMKYRTRLCNHWESNHGLLCPMRKKGKCIFAHGPLELRVKENRRDKWLKNATVGIANNDSFVSSGGEDVFGAARSIEKVRAVEGSLSKFEKSSYTSEISNAPSDYHYSTVVSYPYPHYNPLPPTYAWSGGEETYAKEQQK